jgi:hypothetical protein
MEWTMPRPGWFLLDPRCECVWPAANDSAEHPWYLRERHMVPFRQKLSIPPRVTYIHGTVRFANRVLCPDDHRRPLFHLGARFHARLVLVSHLTQSITATLRDLIFVFCCPVSSISLAVSTNVGPAVSGAFVDINSQCERLCLGILIFS